MNHTRRLLSLCLGLTACQIVITPEADTATTSSSGTGAGHSETGLALPGSSSTSPTTGGSTGSSTTGTASSSDDDGDFIITPDGGSGVAECDVFAQDCEPGQKCTWWADDGGNSWNSTRCVPIAEDPAQIDEACVVEGNGVTGEDNCDLGLMCWDVDAMNHGTCVALCFGTQESPTCPRGYQCSGGRSLMLCFKPCDPLAQNCPGDDLCIPNSDTYVCVLDASNEGQLHEPCEFANACDKGLICLPPTAAPQCDQGANGCCEPMCDLDKPSCPDASQSCFPVYDPQPQGFENVGYCSVEP